MNFLLFDLIYVSSLNVLLEWRSLRQDHFVLHRGVLVDVFLLHAFQLLVLVEGFLADFGVQGNRLTILLVDVCVSLEGELITETSGANIAFVRLNTWEESGMLVVMEASTSRVESTHQDEPFRGSSDAQLARTPSCTAHTCRVFH